MIRAEFFDCGTMFRIYPFQSTPGMDLGYWRELDFEHDWPSERTEQIKAEILAVPHPVEYCPWPRPFPGYMWLDWSRNLYGSIGGPQFELYQFDDVAQDFSIVPSSHAEVYDETQPNIDMMNDMRHLRTSDMLDVQEIREHVEDPIAEPWIRLPTINEATQPMLKNPLVMLHDGHEAPGFALTVNYSPLYQAVDLRYKDRYIFIDDNGNGIDPDLGYQHTMLRNDGLFRIYLAPAKWRMTCNVTAHYYYVSYFESFGVPLTFTKAFFTRPSIYPSRTDVCRTRNQSAIEWLGTDYSYDEGVVSAFERSRGSLTLAQWIIDAQWWTLSEAFIFLFNDPVLIALWQYPPDPGDIVLGVGRVDQVSGKEERVWVVQKQDVLSVYPRTVIGLFFVPWSVVG
jgi:hypothetical protein